METRLQKRERNLALVNRVFANELLLDTILDYAIHYGSNVLISNARSSRLVCRNWYRSISRILLSSCEPLFQICIYDNVCGSKRSEKLLQEFQNLLVHGKGHLNERVPPYSIKADLRNFDENYCDCHELFTFLTICGNGLVKLDVDFLDRFICKPLPLNIFLPKLRSFNIWVWKALNELVTPQDVTKFIRSIFNTSEKLKSFNFFSCTSVHALYCRYNLSNLVFPSSITNVTLTCALIENNLGALTHNLLPNLRKLKLCGYKHDGIISSILENVRKTLRVLSLEAYDGNSSQSSFKLPLMEKLESLELNGFHIKEQCTSLQQLFPVLKHLTLTPMLLLDCADNSPFDTVVSLYVRFSGYSTVQVRHIDTLHNAYPNLQKLELVLDEKHYFECVKVIWRKMTRLTLLSIWFMNPLQQVTSTNVWDALLIGLSEKNIEKLRKAPESWEELQLACDASIRNLTDLHTLQLRAQNWNTSRGPLISDAVFQFAFLRMPKLSKLFLGNDFSATKEMKKQWEEEGRTIGTDEAKSRI